MSEEAADDGYDELVQEIAAQNPEAVLLEEFADALVGYVRSHGTEPVALYDYERVIETLREEGRLSPDQAEIHFEHLVIGEWHGPGTPAFAVIRRVFEEEEAEEESEEEPRIKEAQAPSRNGGSARTPETSEA